MKGILLLAVLALAAVGCAHSQVPPTTWQVIVVWTNPVVNGAAECTTASPCTFVVSRAAPVGGNCPATNASSYTQVASVTANATQVNDPSVVSGTSYCYIVQTQQVIPPATQPATSVPSNTAQVAVPVNPQPPTAPSVTPTPGTTQSGALVEPPMPAPTPSEMLDNLVGETHAIAPAHVTVQLIARR